MKAIVWTKYGTPDGLQLKEVAKPVPRDNEVLIKIHATTATAGDAELRSLNFPAWALFPLRLYIALSGTEEGIGSCTLIVAKQRSSTWTWIPS